MKVTGVKFRDQGRIYDYDSTGFTLKERDIVIVETERGPELGFVARMPMERDPAYFTRSLKKIIRPAGENDMERGRRNLYQEREAKRLCLLKIREHNLPMKLIGVESFLDGSKIIFFFVSEGRVDFRALVKDLASVFKTRIEMRQVGVRNEARMIGGLGNCGREFCCCAFLKEFEPVSVKMAKEQNLALNPQKISGACGRLMCCLAYEIDTYTEMKKDLPKVGKRVVTPQGAGKIIQQNIIHQKVRVALDDGKEVEVGLEGVRVESFFEKYRID
ncbi:MAG: regulatory iron-sulfur-containing complex subunit RicT [Thermodesulfobacteriota bacterium]|nr:regulatory iron-sulfur-containing complex subunit RicT [Thermodesulfobacteriota bacterium]